MSLKETAARCEMSRTMVIAAVKAYEPGGWKAVEVDRGSRPAGSGRVLSAEQECEVQRLIREPAPDQPKMVCALWTRKAAAELIRDRFGVELPVRTMGPVPEALGLHVAEADEEGVVYFSWKDSLSPDSAAAAPMRNSSTCGLNPSIERTASGARLQMPLMSNGRRHKRASPRLPP